VALELMRAGAAGVLVGIGPGPPATLRGVSVWACSPVRRTAVGDCRRRVATNIEQKRAGGAG